MRKNEIVVFWFRRDLRLHDNCGLFHALQSGYKVLPIFIFDEEILNKLPKNDARVSFIYETINDINKKLLKIGRAVKIEKGNVFEVWKKLLNKYWSCYLYSDTKFKTVCYKTNILET